MSQILITGGRILDPSQNLDKVADLLIENGKIKQIIENRDRDHFLPEKVTSDSILATGLLVVPGLIDMHTHLREPGGEAKETIATGLEAAIQGGWTSVAVMANTNPPIDNPGAVESAYKKAKAVGKANLFQIAAITQGMEGRELLDFIKLSKAGVVAFSDDGRNVMDERLMSQAIEKAKAANKIIIDHCEPEEEMVARDIKLAKEIGAKIHIAHISKEKSVELLRKAKKDGVKITAETTPHHLTLYKTLANQNDPNYKMNPPLGTEEDVEAVIEGLVDGTIDAIASDHAPHTAEEKALDFAKAPFGVIGLETTLAIILTKLVATKRITLKKAISAMALAPAKILNVKAGTLTVGSWADITIIDPNKEWIILPQNFKSKSRNTAFAGEKVKGNVVKTIVGGNIFDIQNDK